LPLQPVCEKVTKDVNWASETAASAARTAKKNTVGKRGKTKKNCKKVRRRKDYIIKT
jgi:hypothetical protein